MPNWCSNTVVVSGDAADVSAFKEWLGDGKGLLSKINPTPQELIDTVAGFFNDRQRAKELEEQAKRNIAKYGQKDWYDWNIANWSTKWDVDANLDEYGTTATEVIMSFESAWAPPQNAIAKMAEKFSKLNIRHTYMEEGMCFVGSDEYAGGEPANSFYNDDSESDEWQDFARDEFGWEPWPDEEGGMEETEDGKVSEVPKPIEKPAKKKATKKKATKKVAKKKKKSKKK